MGRVLGVFELGHCGDIRMDIHIVMKSRRLNILPGIDLIWRRPHSVMSPPV